MLANEEAMIETYKRNQNKSKQMLIESNRRLKEMVQSTIEYNEQQIRDEICAYESKVCEIKRDLCVRTIKTIVNKTIEDVLNENLPQLKIDGDKMVKDYFREKISDHEYFKTTLKKSFEKMIDTKKSELKHLDQTYKENIREMYDDTMYTLKEYKSEGPDVLVLEKKPWNNEIQLIEDLKSSVDKLEGLVHSKLKESKGFLETTAERFNKELKAVKETIEETKALDEKILEQHEEQFGSSKSKKRNIYSREEVSRPKLDTIEDVNRYMMERYARFNAPTPQQALELQRKKKEEEEKEAMRKKEILLHLRDRASFVEYDIKGKVEEKIKIPSENKSEKCHIKTEDFLKKDEFDIKLKSMIPNYEVIRTINAKQVDFFLCDTFQEMGCFDAPKTIYTYIEKQLYKELESQKPLFYELFRYNVKLKEWIKEIIALIYKTTGKRAPSFGWEEKRFKYFAGLVGFKFDDAGYTDSESESESDDDLDEYMDF